MDLSEQVKKFRKLLKIKKNTSFALTVNTYIYSRKYSSQTACNLVANA